MSDIKVLCPKFCSHMLSFPSSSVLARWRMTTKRNVIFNRICTFISLLRKRARGLDIDRLRSLNSAINDCVHRLRGSRSNEYDERVAALGERAVHTDLRLIDWTPFHSTTPRHRGSTPAPSISPHEWTNIVDNIKRTAGVREHRWRIEINNWGIKQETYQLSIKVSRTATKTILNYL